MNSSAILEIDNSTTIDMPQGSVDDSANELVFKDYPRTEKSGQTLLPITNSPAPFSSMGDDNSPDDDEDNTLIGLKPTKNKPPSFWELTYFAQYFNVTSRDVISRIIWSFLPIKTGESYLEKYIQHTPDIYGPLWINLTLIFTIAIFGNIAAYFSTAANLMSWHNDWNKLGLAASTVFTYTTLVPLLLWLFFWFRGCSMTYTLFETVCAYGYSLSIYVPISFLMIINITWVKIVLVIIGALLSGSVLIISFTPVVKSDPSSTFKSSYLILLLMMGLHAWVAFSFLFYFKYSL